MDLLYVGVAIGFFALSYGLIDFCDRLHRESTGAESESRGQQK